MIAPALFASAAIIVLSFVSEDAATVSSALSIFGGPVSWPLGFVSCFAGIWVGDLGLYSLARYVGKPILEKPWFKCFVHPATLTKCEESFAQNSSFALIASRFIPGTRLPTYLAAGFFAMPLRRFAVITGIGALIWIAGIFALTKLVGEQALRSLTLREGKIAAIILTALFLATLHSLFKRLRRVVVAGGVDPGPVDVFARSTSRRHRRRLQSPALVRRWMHWEFWPAWLFYIPVGAYYTWLSLRYRSFTLPTATNPGLQNGGFVGESKLEILEQLGNADIDLDNGRVRPNGGLVADAYLVDGWTTTDRLLSLHRICRQRDIALPFILKPDLGQRGYGVRLIKSMREALDYLADVDAPVIVQRYASGQHEAGVFYFRFPGEARGQIFSITEKIFPIITGDGVRTIEQLIGDDRRASLIARTYLQRFAKRVDEILPLGQSLKLVETGNHAQGCIFRDGGHLWSEELERTIDQVSRRIPGFYLGRFDIRYDNETEFRAGRSFKIVELNGASSESTSIYDSRTSLRTAYKVLFRQWKLVFEIGAMNRAHGHRPSQLQRLWHEWRRYSVAAASYPCAS